MATVCSDGLSGGVLPFVGDLVFFAIALKRPVTVLSCWNVNWPLTFCCLLTWPATGHSYPCYTNNNDGFHIIEHILAGFQGIPVVRTSAVPFNNVMFFCPGNIPFCGFAMVMDIAGIATLLLVAAGHLCNVQWFTTYQLTELRVLFPLYDMKFADSNAHQADHLSEELRDVREVLLVPGGCRMWHQMYEQTWAVVSIAIAVDIVVVIVVVAVVVY